MRSLACIVFFVLISPPPALAHEGHADAPGEEAAATNAGPVEVSESAQRNLGLGVEAAELRSVETTLRVIGEIAADPERSGSVSSRISGRVTGVFAQEGERVEKGQPLVEVESRLLGNPPPRVRYAAPLGGIVTDRHAVVGDDVEPSRHFFEVADLSEVLAIGRVFEDRIGQVSVGQRVRVRVPSYPTEIFEGVVVRLGGKLEPESRTLAVYVRVPNPAEKLRPNMRATLSLVTGGADQALAIPKSALLGEAGSFFAFIQSDDRADRFERRALVLGVSDDRYVEVVDGLAPGDRVVVQGNSSLQYLTPVAPEPKAGDATNGSHDSAEEGDAHRSSLLPLLWAAGIASVAIAGLLVLRSLRTRSRPAPEGR